MSFTAAGIKLFFLKVLLELLIFIDFLENLPAKVAKYVSVSFVLSAVIGLSIVFFVTESTTHHYHDAIAYLLIPELQYVESTMPAQYPRLIEKLEFPNISARSLMVVDKKNHKTLYELNSTDPLPPASTTKLMTALVALDSGLDLKRIVTVPEECTEIDSQKAGFLPGEEVTMEDLLYSLLVGSAGDAACAIAYNTTGSYEEFIRSMNLKASEYSLKNTYFTNPVGLDDPNGIHVSSASDLYMLTENVLTNTYLQQIIQTKDYNTTSGKVSRKIFNTNDLLWDVPGTVGVKTGRTYGAGEVLIYEYKKDNADLVIVVMGSEDRFSDTKKILDWSLRSYDFGP